MRIISPTILSSLAYGRFDFIGHIRFYLSAWKSLAEICTADPNCLVPFVTIQVPRVPVHFIHARISFGSLNQASPKKRLSTTQLGFSLASQQKLRYSSKVAMPFQQAIPDSLLDRNQSWSKAFETDQPEIAQALREGQHPKVLWLGCSDSRVPESVVCNARPGELFVLRNVANQFHLHDDSAVSALTFAVQALGVEHIIVVGHTSCGGVAAAVKQVMREQNEETSDLLPNTALNRHLTPLIGLARYSYIKLHERQSMDDAELQDRLMRLVTEASVRQQIQNIADHPVVQDNWSEKESPLNGKVNPRVTLHGWIHNLGTSQLLDLNVTVKPPPLQEKSKTDS
ncbi:carbonic anhydrase [Malassezia psittaci]|uniref:Carbonic anhydrase n=1 Tax=Malassezia psittaci TaxID=1821823 RepID=A0AAF0FD11_9BASI|nr:carbonic anhydrase [Malassezia psittaci]